MGQLIGKSNHRRRCFILLEVMVAIVIVGVAMVALLKGFILSLDTLKKIKMNEKAILLAETLMDDFVLEPPAEGDYEGEFTEDTRFGEEFEGWKWELDVEAEEPDYEERPSGRMAQDLEQLYVAELRVYYDPEGNRNRISSDGRMYVDIHTIILEPDLFSIDALQSNQLF